MNVDGDKATDVDNIVFDNFILRIVITPKQIRLYPIPRSRLCYSAQHRLKKEKQDISHQYNKKKSSGFHFLNSMIMVPLSRLRHRHNEKP